MAITHMADPRGIGNPDAKAPLKNNTPFVWDAGNHSHPQIAATACENAF